MYLTGTLGILVAVALIAVLVWLVRGEGALAPGSDDVASTATSFEECIQEEGSVIMESYPRQCRTSDGRTFTEDIGNELEKRTIIRIDAPRPNAEITSPLAISGEARGMWYFEADFPVRLLDGNGNEIAMAIATAQSNWMTEDFVPFEATLTFTAPTTRTGTLVLEKDNPSGLPEHADELRVPVVFE